VVISKKTGVILTVLSAVLVLCCVGGFFVTNNAFKQIKKTVAEGGEFVTTALKETGRKWDPVVFSQYADEERNTASEKQKTSKMFDVFRVKLGALKSLGAPETSRKQFSQSRDDRSTFLVGYNVKAKFEKGDGVFEVVLRCTMKTKKILTIRLDSNKLMELSKEEAESAKARLEKSK
jgi:hypothetical protein